MTTSQPTDAEQTQPAADAPWLGDEGARPRGGRQVIPRPTSALPGGPPPWAELPKSPADSAATGAAHDVAMTISLARVTRALQGRPPGRRTDVLPQTIDDLLVDAGGTRARAAVLVALFDDDGEARVILTRRAAHLRAHRGEVSFPGGRLEEGESAVDAARRESAEEIGLDPATIRTIGTLSQLATFSSGALIEPVVAALPGRPSLTPNTGEVEQVFDVALADLLADGVFREERWSFPDRDHPLARRDGAFPVWFFELPEDTVWGATARVLVELLRIVLGV